MSSQKSSAFATVRTIKIMFIPILLLLVMPMLIVSIVRPVLSQSSNCDSLWEASGGISPFPEGTVIYLNLTALKNSTDAKLKAWADQTAISAENWNQGLNQMGVVNSINYTNTPPAGAPIITVKPGPASPDNPSAPAYIPKFGPDAPTFNSAGLLQSMTVLLNLSATIPGTTSLSADPLTSSTIGTKVMNHEIGHGFGLKESTNAGGTGCFNEIKGATVMNSICGPNDSGGNMPTGITPCDMAKAAATITGSSTQPTPTPTPAPEPEFDCYPYCTPVIVDVLGDGYSLTSAADGVDFDFNGDGKKERISWTTLYGDDAFLVLDRNGDGLITRGTELFGNLTPQAASATPNGFLALMEFDRVPNGGNADGVIDAQDSIYSSAQFRLWQDTNHNGISEATELITLAAGGIEFISLDYKESRRKDQHGNLFRYRAKVNGSKSAWDVFLVTQ